MLFVAGIWLDDCYAEKGFKIAFFRTIPTKKKE